MMILAVVLYIAIGTLIAVYAKRGIKTQDDYFVGGRRISGFVSALTYAATTYSAFMMIGLVGFAYKTGIGSAGFELMYLIGTLLLLSYYAPKIWSIAKEKGLVSPAEIFSERYDPLVSRLATIIAMISLIPYTSIQIIGIALILGIDYTQGVLIASIVVALWAFIGGLRGVALTDAIQGIFMLTMAIVAVLWVGNNLCFGISKSAEFPNEFWTPIKFASLTIPWFFFAMTNPQVFQRIFIPKDRGALRRMVLLFGLFGLTYTVLVTLLGLSLRLATDKGIFPFVADRDKVTPILLDLMPSYLALPIALSILMASVTTANSIILTLSSMVLRDLIGEKRGVLMGRMMVLIITFVVALFALKRISYIVELAVLSSTLLLCQIPLIFGIFHWDMGGKKTGIATLLSGFILAIVLSAIKCPYTSILVFLISFAVFFLTSLTERSKSNAISFRFRCKNFEA